MGREEEGRDRKIMSEGMIPVTEDLMRYADFAEKVCTLESALRSIPRYELLMRISEITSETCDFHFETPYHYNPLEEVLDEKIEKIQDYTHRIKFNHGLAE